MINLPKVKNIEKIIWELEGFDVKFKYLDGRDVRGDLSGISQNYSFSRCAKNDMTVNEWKNVRFKPKFPGFDVDVLDGDGNSVDGHTKLGTVRDTYSDD